MTPAIDLAREIELAELLLAAQDMMHVLEYLSELRDEVGDTPRTIKAAVKIVTAYCRPFTRNNRMRILGKAWIKTYDEGEIALHQKALQIRSRDLAHTHNYDGRVQVQIQSIPDSDGPEITYSPITSIQGLTRIEYEALWIMVGKVREAIEAEKRPLAQCVLRARVAAGYSGRFTLGEI